MSETTAPIPSNKEYAPKISVVVMLLALALLSACDTGADDPSSIDVERAIGYNPIVTSVDAVALDREDPTVSGSLRFGSVLFPVEINSELDALYNIDIFMRDGTSAVFLELEDGQHVAGGTRAIIDGTLYFNIDGEIREVVEEDEDGLPTAERRGQMVQLDPHAEIAQLEEVLISPNDEVILFADGNGLRIGIETGMERTDDDGQDYRLFIVKDFENKQQPDAAFLAAFPVDAEGDLDTSADFVPLPLLDIPEMFPGMEPFYYDPFEDTLLNRNMVDTADIDFSVEDGTVQRNVKMDTPLFTNVHIAWDTTTGEITELTYTTHGGSTIEDTDQSIQTSGDMLVDSGTGLMMSLDDESERVVQIAGYNDLSKETSLIQELSVLAENYPSSAMARKIAAYESGEAYDGKPLVVERHQDLETNKYVFVFFVNGTVVAAFDFDGEQMKFSRESVALEASKKQFTFSDRYGDYTIELFASVDIDLRNE